MTSDDLLLHAARRAAERQPDHFAAVAFWRAARLHGIPEAEIPNGIARLLGCDTRTVCLISFCLLPRSAGPTAVAEWVREVAPEFGVDPERLAGIMLAGMEEGER